MFHQFYRQNDPVTANGICQKQDTRWLVQNPPALPPSTDALDAIYELPFTHNQHPFYAKKGDVRALEEEDLRLVNSWLAN